MKTITTTSSLADKMDAYLQGHWPVIPKSLLTNESKRIKRRTLIWGNEILEHLSAMPPLEKAVSIESLDYVSPVTLSNGLSPDFYHII